MFQPRMLVRDEHDNVWNYTDHLFDLGSTDGVRLGIDGVTGELRSYWHHALIDANPGLDPGSKGPRIKAMMREEEVRQIVEDYLVLSTHIQLKEYQIRLWYEETHWFVVIARRLNGIPFRIDGVRMRYSEEYGLFLYENTMFSDECELEPRLRQEAIVEAAGRYLERLMVEHGAAFEVDQADLQGPTIVNPGLFAEGKRPPMSELRRSRVAWTVHYAEKKPAVVAPDRMPRVVFVYVDAITGDLLGYKTFW